MHSINCMLLWSENDGQSKVSHYYTFNKTLWSSIQPFAIVAITINSISRRKQTSSQYCSDFMYGSYYRSNVSISCNASNFYDAV